MKKWLRQYLGITEVQEDQGLLNRRFREVLTELAAVKGQTIASNRGMGRLLVKLDPLFGVDELDPARKADSDRIGQDIIKKLIGEHVASNRPNV